MRMTRRKPYIPKFGLPSIASILGFSDFRDPTLSEAICKLASFTLKDIDNIELVKMTMHQIMKLQTQIRNTANKNKKS